MLYETPNAYKSLIENGIGYTGSNLFRTMEAKKNRLQELGISNLHFYIRYNSAVGDGFPERVIFADKLGVVSLF